MTTSWLAGAAVQSRFGWTTPSLLDRVFRGQFVRQNPNDAPASRVIEILYSDRWISND